ncbi:MAG: hypothetical protein RSD57_10410 [Comamonas sp.]
MAAWIASLSDWVAEGGSAQQELSHGDRAYGPAGPWFASGAVLGVVHQGGRLLGEVPLLQLCWFFTIQPRFTASPGPGLAVAMLTQMRRGEGDTANTGAQTRAAFVEVGNAVSLHVRQGKLQVQVQALARVRVLGVLWPLGGLLG